MELVKYPDGKGGYIYLPTYCPATIIDRVANDLSVRDDDIFIVTYPKSGTTWTQRIIWLLLNNASEQDKAISEVMPWLEVEEGFNSAKNMDSPRYMTSHLPYALLPHTNGSRAKYIYVARNPKDCVVSGYHFYSNLMINSSTWDDYLSRFIKGEGPFGDWFTHVLDWYEASQKSENILFIKYEEMKKDLSAVLSTLAKCLDVRLTAELVADVLKRSQFSSMSKNTQTNYSWIDWKNQKPKMMRKGVIGDWQNHFSAEQNIVFDALYQERMKNSTLEFEFKSD